MGHRLGKSLAEISELDPEELALWAAFYRDFDPDKRMDRHFAEVLCAIWNAVSMHARGYYKVRDMSVAEVMGETEPEGSAQDAQRRLEVWAANVGTVVFAKGEQP